jgi:heme-degrading monooxygenase HmoA
MIVSVHLANVGAGAPWCLRHTPTSERAPGLRYAAVTLAAPLGGELLPRVRPGRIGLIAAWDDDEALDRFLAEHPLARRLEVGWHLRMTPLRASGTWSALPELEHGEGHAAPGEPVAAVTLGRLRTINVVRFLRASAAASKLASESEGLVASSALARPPHLVATFSLWRTLTAMQDYVHGRNGAGHRDAIRAHTAKPFHHESIFVRLRPYRSAGRLGGRDPFEELSAAAAPTGDYVAAGSAWTT